MNTAAAAAVVDLFNSGDDDDEPDDAAPPGVVMIRGSIVEAPPRDEPLLTGEAPAAARAHANDAHLGGPRAEAAARTAEVRHPADDAIVTGVRDVSPPPAAAVGTAQAPTAVEESGAAATGALTAGNAPAGGVIATIEMKG